MKNAMMQKTESYQFTNSDKDPLKSIYESI